VWVMKILKSFPVDRVRIALMMEAVICSDTSVCIYQTTRRNIPEDSHLHTRRRENLIRDSPWRWRQQVPLKCLLISTRLHGATLQKIHLHARRRENLIRDSPWRWMQQVSLKRRLISTRLHGATFQNTVAFILVAVRTWFALTMEAASSSETSAHIYQTTRRNIPEDSHLRGNVFLQSLHCFYLLIYSQGNVTSLVTLHLLNLTLCTSKSVRLAPCSLAFFKISSNLSIFTLRATYRSSGRKVTQLNFYGLLLALHTN
jgi:hypothetical protein